MIRSGRVQLNESIRLDAETPVELRRDRISVEGRKIRAQGKMYVVMNKPRGLMTTAADEKGRKTIYSLIPGEAAVPWLAPVGRLDKASEGLLLLTNDSEWGARIASPETHLEKKYHVQIGTIADEKLLAALSRGLQTETKGLLRIQHVRILRKGEKHCWLEIVLDQGKNRHIRRMLEAVGVDVLRLVRVAIGPLQLGRLAKGAFRPLTEGEKRSLDRAMRESRTRKLAQFQDDSGRVPL